MAPLTIRVFVSSTWLDLQPERAALEVAVHRMRGTKFVGMEHFGSREEDTETASLEDVDQSDLLVVVVGGRYGSGIVEKEYLRARERELPCLVYLKDPASIAPEWIDPEPARLDRF